VLGAVPLGWPLAGVPPVCCARAAAVPMKTNASKASHLIRWWRHFS
jgi:hypothetical protein